MSKENTKKEEIVKKPKKLRLFIILGILAIVIGVFIFRMFGGSEKTLSVDVGEVIKTSIRQTINTTGIVESEKSENITTQANYKVDELLVKEGDSVKVGDILAQLNPDDLNAQLTQLRASVSKAQSSANHGTSVAERGLEDTEEKSVENYEKQIEKLESDLMTANETLEEAMINYRLQAGIDAENWIPLTPGDEDTTVKSARNRADQAERNRDALKTELDTARINLEKAKSGELSDIKSAEDSLTSSKIQGNLYSEYLQIEELEKKISDTTIKATADGIVTLINVKQGQHASGLMFVIEDLEKSKIETNVGEYDINSISVGSDVIIKSEATGETEYKGKISAISPTANKTPTGEVATANVQFKVTVDILEKDDALKLGMNARLTIIVNEKSDALTVPYNSIRTTPEGQDFVYVAVPSEDGSNNSTAKMILVKVGLESDIDVEIISEELKEGDMVVTNPDAVFEGMAFLPMVSSGGFGGAGSVDVEGGNGSVIMAPAGGMTRVG